MEFDILIPNVMQPVFHIWICTWHWIFRRLLKPPSWSCLTNLVLFFLDLGLIHYNNWLVFSAVLLGVSEGNLRANDLIFILFNYCVNAIWKESHLDLAWLQQCFFFFHLLHPNIISVCIFFKLLSRHFLCYKQ